MSYDFPSLSFVIPCFNEGKKLIRCLSSIYTGIKTFEFEVILVDNGSTDNCIELALEKFPSVIMIRSSANSVSGVRNQGVKLAKNELLVFIDGDIELSESWELNLTEVVKKFGFNSTLFGSHVLEPINETCFPKGWYDDAIFHMDHTHINSGHMLISRDSFNEIGGFDEALKSGEDYEISKRYLEHGGLVSNRPELIAYHLGFPKDLLEFFRREMWHGKGDFVSIKSAISSKVSLISILLVAMLACSIVLILVGYVGLSFLFSIGAILLCFMCAQIKYSHIKLSKRIKYSFVFFLYFAARATNIPSVLRVR